MSVFNFAFDSTKLESSVLVCLVFVGGELIPRSYMLAEHPDLYRALARNDNQTLNQMIMELDPADDLEGIVFVVGWGICPNTKGELGVVKWLSLNQLELEVAMTIFINRRYLAC